MTANKFVTPPPIQGDQPGRLALVWAGNPGWTTKNLSVDNTRPGDSSVNLGISDEKAAAVMPLAAKQARELAHELIIRADLIDPNGAAS